MSAPRPPTVGIWKTTWLPPSQTFVRSQIEALCRWEPMLFGLRLEKPGIPMPVRRAPFGTTRPAKLVRRASALTGYRFIYDGVLRQAAVQVIHAHFGAGAIEILPVARRHGIPLVVTFHGFDVLTLPSGPDGDRYRRRLAGVFDYAHTLIAVSQFLAEELVKLGAPRDKIKVLYIGTPVQQRTESNRDRAGITFVGRFTEGKGVLDFIEAIRSLAPEQLDGVPVRMIGTGPLFERVRGRVQELDLPIQLLGRQPLYEVHRTLASSSIFCGPSHQDREGWQEAFGIVFLEAAQHGLPVVAYRHGGVPEAVAEGRTALLSAEGDVAGMAADLARLLAEPQLAHDLGAAGARRVAALFDIKECTAKLEDVYDDAATGRR